MRTRSKLLSPGGLGKLIQNVFETWLCDREDPCAGPNDAMCYAYNEKAKVFQPMGPNSHLKMVKLLPRAVAGKCTDSFCVNGGAENQCDDPAYTRINDVEECKETASRLGLKFRGEGSLDYCARGCFVYDVSKSESYGVWFNTHHEGGEASDHHLICRAHHC